MQNIFPCTHLNKLSNIVSVSCLKWTHDIYEWEPTLNDFIDKHETDSHNYPYSLSLPKAVMFKIFCFALPVQRTFSFIIFGWCYWENVFRHVKPAQTKLSLWTCWVSLKPSLSAWSKQKSLMKSKDKIKTAQTASWYEPAEDTCTEITFFIYFFSNHGQFLSFMEK